MITIMMPVQINDAKQVDNFVFQRGQLLNNSRMYYYYCYCLPNLCQVLNIGRKIIFWC